MRAPVSFLFAAVVCFVGVEAEPQLQVTESRQLGALLRISGMVSDLAIPELPGGGTIIENDAVTNLGEDAVHVVQKTSPSKRNGIRADLHALQAILARFSPADQPAEPVRSVDLDLGETDESELKKRKARILDSKKLEALMLVSSDEDSRDVVKRVLQYLNSEIEKGADMTVEQVDQIRQFYIDRTAAVLAEFGYEDSSFGKHDISSGRPDALISREHLDQQDELLHLEQASTPKGSYRPGLHVMQYLQETSHLADWLDKATQVETKTETAKNGHQLDAETQHEIDKLAHDEDDIEAGINSLLDTIKDVHFPIADAQAVADQSDSALATSAKPKTPVKIPLPRLEKKLRGYVTTHLEKVQTSLDRMKATGQMINAKKKRTIHQYLRTITAHLLNSYLSYQDWTDKGAMKEESDAIADGDPERPSRIQNTQTMSKKDIVEHFLAETWKKPSNQAVSKPVASFLMDQTIALPGGGHVMIVTGDTKSS